MNEILQVIAAILWIALIVLSLKLLKLNRKVRLARLELEGKIIEIVKELAEGLNELQEIVRTNGKLTVGLIEVLPKKQTDQNLALKATREVMEARDKKNQNLNPEDLKNIADRLKKNK